MRRSILIALATLLAALGCSVDSAGIADDQSFGDAEGDTANGGSDSAPAIDTGTILPTDGAPSDTSVAPDTFALDSALDSAPDVVPPDVGPEVPLCDLSSCATPPAGARRVGLVDRGVACPPGFKASDVFEPLAGADACSCACGLKSPTCPAAGSIATGYGKTDSCELSPGRSLGVAGSGVCAGLTPAGGFGAFFKATPLGPPSGGSCSVTLKADKGAGSQPLRLCEPNPTTCEAPICATAFTECIELSGACPSDYGTPRIVAADVTVSCPPCNCTLSSGTCAGRLDFFGGDGCAGTKTSLVADDSCVGVPAGAGTIKSYSYFPDPPSGASCAASYTTDVGTRTPVAPKQLCCRLL